MNAAGRVPLRERWPTVKARIAAGLASYRRMLAYVRPYWFHLSLAAASLVVISLLGLALPWAVQQLVDSVVVAEDLAPLNNLALLLAGIFVLRAALGFVQTYLVAWVGERVVARLRGQLYEHLLSLSLDFFNRQRVGALVSRLSSDVQVIQGAVTSNLIILLQQVVTAAGILVVAATMSWRLTALMGVAVPGMVLITRLLGRRMRVVARGVQDALAEASAVVEETAGGIRIVKSFAREEHEKGRYQAKIDRLFQLAMERTRIYATFGPLMSLVTYGALALVLYAGGREALAGNLTAGQLIAFLFYASMLAGPLGSFGNLYGQLQGALGATERVFDLLDQVPGIREAPDAMDLPVVAGHVAFQDVVFDYDPRQPVLCGVSIEALPGEVIALVGPSGVGKTTLANLIPRFYDVSGGCVTIDGHDVRNVTLRSLREQIGFVPQETLLFSDTIAANMRYGRLDATQAAIEAAARAANAHDFIVNDLPDGYNTQVGERGIKLSGGQRQRIAIARAILKDPRILILDEATSSLDTESERLVQEALEHLMRPVPSGGDGSGRGGRTTFVIAHRLSTIVNADKIVVLSGGCVVECGTHDELLARPDGLYRRYHALQFSWDEPPAPPPGDDDSAPARESEPWPAPYLSLFSPAPPSED